MLLDTAVDVTQLGSGQHVGCLLVDQGVKVSLDLEHVGESGLSIMSRWYLWLIVSHCDIDNELPLELFWRSIIKDMLEIEARWCI